MQNSIYKEDKGKKFGNWNDPVSKLLYMENTQDILNKIPIPNIVGDFGGANGHLKKWIPGSISIDFDKSKKPDIVDNILTHSKHYELGVIRYVLHYLTDKQIIELFENINCDHILIIQFVNSNLIDKYKNSQNEIKHFRTHEQIMGLLPKGFLPIYSKEFIVTEDFYKNRLGPGRYFSHSETIKGYYK